MITIESILLTVSNLWAVPIPHIVSRSHRRTRALARHICMYLARELTAMTFTEIGEVLGGLDSSTTHRGHQVISAKMAIDHALAAAINLARRDLVDGSRAVVLQKLLRACQASDHLIESLLADRIGATDDLLIEVRDFARVAAADAQPFVLFPHISQGDQPTCPAQ